MKRAPTALASTAAALVAGCLSAAALLAPATAEACSPPPEGWQLSMVWPSSVDQAIAPDDGILIVGNAFSRIPTFDELDELITVTVIGPDGAPVDGALHPGLNVSHLIWKPGAPLAADTRYSVELELAPQWDWDQPQHESFEIRVGAPERPSAQIDGAYAEGFEVEIHGECLDEEAIAPDSCGGFHCEAREVLRVEQRFFMETTVTVDATPGEVVYLRAAMGVDGPEARAIAERTRWGLVHIHDGTLTLDDAAGPIELWPSDTACFAVQIVDAFGEMLLDDFTCAEVPGAEPEKLLGGPAPIAVDDSAGGCDASGQSRSGSALWALALLVGLGSRRRRGALLAAAALIGLAGCAPESQDASDNPDCPGEACGAPPIDSTGRPLPALIRAEQAPPAITGGTLAATPDGHIMVAADPARDRVQIIIGGRQVRATLPAVGQPGRVVIDPDGERAFVALRQAGAVMAIDLGDDSARTFATCPAPRGLALTADARQLHVACAGGHLLTLDAQSGAVTRKVPVDTDLRDVVLVGERTFVTRFRAAELIELDAAGVIIDRRQPPTTGVIGRFMPTAPNVAWRTVATPDGDLIMLHQRSRLSHVRLTRDHGYGGSGEPTQCGEAIVAPALTAFRADGAVEPLGLMPTLVLGVDLAADGDGVTVAAPGTLLTNRFGAEGPPAQSVIHLDPEEMASRECFFPEQVLPTEATAEVTSVVRLADGRVFGLQREPAALIDLAEDEVIPLPGDSVADAGHDLFHKDAGRHLACASCHPEGSDDGHTWLFEDQGLRRTQELRGGLKGTAPFHWTGDMTDFSHLMGEVMHRRMGGPALDAGYQAVFLDWIDRLAPERVEPLSTGDAVAGELVFEDATVGCASCHSGPRLADNQRYDVGTGGIFETATLRGIGRRTNLMHDGCAPTLADRFDPSCGGGERHGRTAHLSADQLDDLIAYLETL